MVYDCEKNACERAKKAGAVVCSREMLAKAAAKAHLRNEKPLLVAISTNDALGMNMKNIGLLLNTKHIYFVPFKQDNPQKRPNSMIASLEYVIPAAEAALDGRQYQPIIQ